MAVKSPFEITSKEDTSLLNGKVIDLLKNNAAIMDTKIKRTITATTVLKKFFKLSKKTDNDPFEIRYQLVPGIGVEHIY